ncbi:MAG: hypothetical protein ACI9SJ_001818 [Flavobacteriaceae bacterium]|jgi:hypothetical protein|uniref:DUF4270 domain-containing protein n=1 Tax=Candidatus Marifrigoribacter sp. Uisw_064 TaxID=3230970 RepID=UPI003AE6CD2C
MKLTKIVPQIGVILFFIIALASCEEDFNTIGVDIIGDEINNVDSIIDRSVIAYSKKINAVETNNLPAYKLGTYKDPIFGLSTADLVSQIVMPANDPSFGEDDEDAYPVVVDSVYLYIPFFNESTEVETGTFTYELDSIFGNAPFQFSVYESNYFLNDFDPESNFEETQKYYSTLGEVFNTNSNIGDLLYETNDFTPSNEGYRFTRIDENNDTLVLNLDPGIRVALSNEFFLEKIINQQGEPELLNNSTFQEYFRGILIDVEAINGMGSLFIFDINNANITIYYGYDTNILDDDENPIIDTEDLDEDGDVTEFVTEKNTEEFEFSFSGINTNMLTTEDLIDFDNPDIVNGEESLYLRGGDGYVTVIELFGEDNDDNGVADELEAFRNQQWLINEANLIFYVDQDQVTGGSSEPERILIYDLNNDRVLVDYGFDLTQGESPENALTQHLGKLERGNDENGDYYKIRITNHISNLINRDSTNISLGLVVSQNVVQGGFKELETIDEPVTTVPSSCVISTEGTVLHGNLSPNEGKQLKLRIYYTDPN